PLPRRASSGPPRRSARRRRPHRAGAARLLRQDVSMVLTELRPPSQPLSACRGGSIRVLLAFDWFWKYAAAQAVALRQAGAEVAVLGRTHLHEFAGRADEHRRLLDRLDESGVQTLLLPGRVRSPSSLP